MSSSYTGEPGSPKCRTRKHHQETLTDRRDTQRKNRTVHSREIGDSEHPLVAEAKLTCYIEVLLSEDNRPHPPCDIS